LFNTNRGSQSRKGGTKGVKKKEKDLGVNRKDFLFGKRILLTESKKKTMLNSGGGYLITVALHENEWQGPGYNCWQSV